MQLIIVFYPLLIGKYQRRSFKADPMLPNVGLVLVVVPFNKDFSDMVFIR